MPVSPEEASPAPSGGVTTLAFGGQAPVRSPLRGPRTETGVGPQTWAEQRRVAGQAAPAPPPSSTPGRWSTTPPTGPDRRRRCPSTKNTNVTPASLGAGSPWPAYAASAEGELDGEAALAGDFAGLAAPLGAAPASGLAARRQFPQRAERASCGCDAAYYAIQNAHVEVVVLDDSAASGSVEAAQRAWLEQQLQQAGAVLHKPVIVVGEADLGAAARAGQARRSRRTAVRRARRARSRRAGPGPLRRLGLLLRRARRQRREDVLLRTARACATFGSGTLGYELRGQRKHAAEFHGAKGILLGEVLWGTEQRGRTCGRRRARAGAADPGDRRTGDGTQGRDAAAPQPGRAVQRASRAGRGRAAGAQRAQEPVRRRPVHPDPLDLRRGPRAPKRCCPNTNSAPREPDVGAFVKLNTAAGRRKSSGGASRARAMNAKGEPVPDGHEERGEQVGGHLGALLRLQQGRNRRHDQRRRPLLHAARAGPGRQRARAVRHRAAARTGRRQPERTRPRAAARARARAAAARPAGGSPPARPPPPPVPPPPVVPARAGGPHRPRAARRSFRSPAALRAAARVRAAAGAHPGATHAADGHLGRHLARRGGRTRRRGGGGARVGLKPGARLPRRRTRARAHVPARSGAAGGSRRCRLGPRAPAPRPARGTRRAGDADHRPIPAPPRTRTPASMVSFKRRREPRCAAATAASGRVRPTRADGGPFTSSSRPGNMLAERGGQRVACMRSVVNRNGISCSRSRRCSRSLCSPARRRRRAPKRGGSAKRSRRGRNSPKRLEG